MIDRFSSDNLLMFAVLISATQITKETGQSRNHKGHDELEKTAEIYFSVTLKTVVHKEDIEKE